MQRECPIRRSSSDRRNRLEGSRHWPFFGTAVMRFSDLRDDENRLDVHRKHGPSDRPCHGTAEVGPSRWSLACQAVSVVGIIASPPVCVSTPTRRIGVHAERGTAGDTDLTSLRRHVGCLSPPSGGWARWAAHRDGWAFVFVSQRAESRATWPVHSCDTGVRPSAIGKKRPPGSARLPGGEGARFT